MYWMSKYYCIFKKNNTNKEYFNIVENIEKSHGLIDSAPIDTIIINKDNYIYIRKSEKNLVKILRCIDKNLLGNDSCCICMESKSVKLHFVSCHECQTPICRECICKMDGMNCPCCKSDLSIIEYYNKANK